MPENEQRDEQMQRHRAASVETMGLLVIAIVLVILLLWRWGGDIGWSAR